MNLIADIGNTSAKLAIFKSSEKISVNRYDDIHLEILKDQLYMHKVSKAIVSSVRDIPTDIFESLQKRVPFVHILTYNSKFPFRIDYETPESLGMDRVAGIAGAYNNLNGSNVLLIDAGTAVTFDLLIDKRFIGGNISPGIEMRFRALNKFTGKLPLLMKSEKYTSPGKNTSDAIIAGVQSGLIFEINEYIRTFGKKHKKLKVIITGGDGEFLSKSIDYEHSYQPDIVIEGLNYILEYNA
jgi:type III pantothenate kinase